MIHIQKILFNHQKAKCWPAGHASGGFAHGKTIFLFKTPINQKELLIIGLVVFWVWNLQDGLGDHFEYTISTKMMAT